MKYNPEKHPQLLKNSFADLRGIEDFCFKADINKDTFTEWVKTYPEFKEAYKKAKLHAQSLWDHLPLDKPNINIAYWSLMKRNRFGSKLRKIAGKSIKEKIRIYEEALETEAITPDRYCKLIASLGDEMKAKDALKDDTIERENYTDEEMNELVKRMTTLGYTEEQAGRLFLVIAETEKAIFEKRRAKNLVSTTPEAPHA